MRVQEMMASIHDGNEWAELVSSAISQLHELDPSKSRPEWLAALAERRSNSRQVYLAMTGQDPK